MNKIEKLFKDEMHVINLGLSSFGDAMDYQHTDCVRVDWTPPAFSDPSLLYSMLDSPEIDEANMEAYRRINTAEPVLTDIVFAGHVLPGMKKNRIGHAGPPIEFKDMCGPMKGAVLGACVYEGLAVDLDDAQSVVDRGEIELISNHSMGAVGPMTGIVTYSMPLLEVTNETYGNKGYCTINEGLGKVMRFGANDESVIMRLKWIETVLAPALKDAIGEKGPIVLSVLISKALTMGDEMHQRNIAATSLFVREIAPALSKVVDEREQLSEIMGFITGNDQFFLNLVMAAGKAIMDPVQSIPNSTVVTAMCRNGTNFGIKVSALGDEWFQAPVEMPIGLYFPGFSEKDANPDMGDSAICETFGIGGFAMGTAPAIIRFVGAASVKQAMDYTNEMKEITVGLSERYQLPPMEFMGSPTGIDIRKVGELGLTPVINTGMAHKNPGIGQVGAGIVRAPFECFEKALRKFGELKG